MTLLEFYEDLGTNPGWENVADSMIVLIQMVDEMFTETNIWGLTSHASLILLAEDDWRSHSHVAINCTGRGRFEILSGSENEAKKPGMDVANSYEEARKLLILAMARSGGWPDSDELQRIAKSIEPQ